MAKLDLSRLIAIRDMIDELITVSANVDLSEEAKELTNASTTTLPASTPILGVIVGHTKVAPGASGIAPINQSEYPWNLDLAAKIKAVGLAQGVDVRVRLRDNVGISGAYKEILKVKPLAVVELHFNASDGTAAGTETLYGRTISKAWAQHLQDEMVALYGRTGKQQRGIKLRTSGDRGYESVTQLTDIPSALIEPFFGDHAGDAGQGQAKKDQLAAVLIAAFKKQIA